MLELAAVDGLPVYLESTEVAVPMYQKLGLQVIDGFDMRIPRPGSGEVPGSTELSGIYLELCMVWYPPSSTQDAERSRWRVCC